MEDGERIERVFATLAEVAGTAPLSESEAEALLDLARVMAHDVERKLAPLATYAIGLALDPAEDVEERVHRIRLVIEAVEGGRITPEGDRAD